MEFAGGSDSQHRLSSPPIVIAGGCRSWNAQDRDVDSCGRCAQRPFSNRPRVGARRPFNRRRIWQALGLDLAACQEMLGEVHGEVSEFRKICNLFSSDNKATSVAAPAKGARQNTSAGIGKTFSRV